MNHKFLAALLFSAVLLLGCDRTPHDDLTIGQDTLLELESGTSQARETGDDLKRSEKSTVPAPNLGGLSVCPSDNEVCYPCSPDTDWVEMNGGLLFVNGLLTDVHSVTTIDGELFVSLDVICDILGYDMSRMEIEHLRTGADDIFVSPEELPRILPEVEVCVYDGTRQKGIDESDTVRMVWGIPNIMVSAYPEEALPCTAADAVERLREGLIFAYEARYGAFEPLHTEPETWLSDETNLRYEITALDVCAENDRFYIIPLYGYYYVDKYTDTIYRYYNGYAQTITEFDPADPFALTFAG